MFILKFTSLRISFRPSIRVFIAFDWTVLNKTQYYLQIKNNKLVIYLFSSKFCKFKFTHCKRVAVVGGAGAEVERKYEVNGALGSQYGGVR